jgi:hypothetical protein
MPEIPTYTSKGAFPAGNLQRIPQGIESGVSKVIEDAGAKVAYLGTAYDAAIEHAKEVAAMGTLKSRAMVELNDLSNRVAQSPEFFVDPQSARNQWKQQSEALKTSMMGGIHPDSRLSREFDVAWQGLTAQHEIHLANEIKKKSVDQVVGGSLQALQNYSNAIGSSPNPQVVYKALAAIHDQINGGIATGAFTYEQGQRLEEHYRNQALSAYGHNLMVNNPEEVLRQLETVPGEGEKDSHPLSRLSDTHKSSLRSSAHSRLEHLRNQGKSDLEKAIRTNAYQLVHKQFALDGPDADFDAAEAFAADPKNWASMGVQTEQQAFDVVNNIRNVHATRLRLRERERKDYVNKVNNGLLPLYIEGRLTQNDVMQSGLDEPQVQHWMNLIDRQEIRRDQKYLKETKLAREKAYDNWIGKVYRDEVEDESELILIAGREVDPDKIPGLVHSFQKRKDVSHNRYMDMALREYRRQFGKNEDYAPREAEFISTLDFYVKDEKLTGTAIAKKAQELMERQSFWYNPATWGTPKYKWESDLANSMKKTTEKAPDPVKKELDKIPGPDRQQIADYLQSKGKVVNDANILKAWRMIKGSAGQ